MTSPLCALSQAQEMSFLIKSQVSAPLREARKAFQKHACDFTWNHPCLGLGHQLSCGQESVVAYMGIQAMDSIPLSSPKDSSSLNSHIRLVFFARIPSSLRSIRPFRSNDSKGKQAEYLAWKVVMHPQRCLRDRRLDPAQSVKQGGRWEGRTGERGLSQKQV